MKILLKWFRTTFLGECSNCDRKLNKEWVDNWFSYKCKCGQTGFGHTLTNREL
jgi:hypothetical protein